MLFRPTLTPTLYVRQRRVIAVAAAVCVVACSETEVPSDPVTPAPQAGAPALQIESGSGQTVAAGEMAPRPIIVRATDSRGQALPALTVTLTATSSEARFLPAPSLETDADGRAEFNFLAPTGVGPLRIAASAPGASQISVPAEVAPGPPTSIALELQPEHVRIGQAATLSLTASDRYGNAAPAPPDVGYTLGGQVASFDGARIVGVSEGDGVIVATAGTLQDSLRFVVFGRLWRRELNDTPLHMELMANGSLLVLTASSLDLLEPDADLIWSLPLPGRPSDLALDEAAGTAYVSLNDDGMLDNIVAVDVASGIVERIESGAHRAAYLSLDPVSGMLLVVHNGGTLCLLSTTDASCRLHTVGNLPVMAAMDAAAGVVLVSNHFSHDASLISMDGAVTTVKAGSYPWGVAVDPTRHLGVVTNSMAHDVTLIDLAEQRSLGEVETGMMPIEAIVDSETGLAVIQHADGTVTWLDLAATTVVGSVRFDDHLLKIRRGGRKLALVIPSSPGRLFLAKIDRPQALPDLELLGRAADAAVLPTALHAVVATVLPPGIELHRLPVFDALEH